MTLRAAIIGPTGYTGLYLIQWLLRHPQAQLTYLASHREQLPDIRQEFPCLAGRLRDEIALCQPIDPQAIAAAADVAFMALPHKAAMSYAPQLLDAGLRVIDLSADYRFADADQYETIYQTPHTDRDHLALAGYGLPELFREQLHDAKLIANPGCYPTAAALAIAPLLRAGLVSDQSILINAASGATGAGRKEKPNLHFPEHNQAYMAYGQIGGHRHQPELEQTLNTAVGRPVPVLFVPHLLPIDRGILETIYLVPEQGVTQAQLFEAYENAYAHEPFVRVKQELPNVKHVVDTNFCDLSVRLVDSHVVVFAAIDNMLKGASGQAIQNMNLMFGLDETTGLL